MKAKIDRIQTELAGLSADQRDKHNQLREELRELQRTRANVATDLLDKFELELRSVSNTVDNVSKCCLCALFCFILLTHEGSYREVLRDFQPCA